MINFLSKITNRAENKLNDILKPVEEDLNRLEMKLSESLTSGNTRLDEITGYIIKTGGKRLRPALVFLFAKALNNGFLSSNHFYLGEAVEMVHTASLIHDDVIDEAETRRGFLTVGKKWNYRTAVIVGDFILARSLTKLVSVGGVATELFANMLNELCIGEIQQGDQKFKIISFEDYIKKSERKTAKLFVAGAECAATITPDANNLIIKAVRDYSLNFGIAFQIMDDILNFTGNRKKVGKPAGNDLKNGILTAPVLFALEEFEKNKDSTLKKLINNKLKGKKDFNQAMNLILKSNGIQKSRDLTQYYIEEAINALEVMEDSIYKKSLINLAVYTLKREF
ncbi:MAG TPA: solanesyl diphosphate synthase [Cyanobacteria bacterium UBA9971]|nr:solanesyl diphosphate synthase [Cyanobacteria bacterium UBA9971]